MGDYTFCPEANQRLGAIESGGFRKKAQQDFLFVLPISPQG